MKLTREGAAQQASKRLAQLADAREELVEKQEAMKRRKKTNRRVNNTHSQRESRARKKAEEVLSGVRDPDGKIKVIGPSARFMATVIKRTNP